VIVGDGPKGSTVSCASAALTTAILLAVAASETSSARRADVLVLSLMEGLPIVLMEAMAMGTAVIASRVAGIPELVKDGENGVLFTPSDWDDLAACMRRMQVMMRW
jgi:glycosyltransferase involved in cell wall biosynthesis